MTAPARQLPQNWLCPGGKVVFEATELRERGEGLIDVRFLPTDSRLVRTIVWAVPLDTALNAAREFIEQQKRRQRAVEDRF